MMQIEITEIFDMIRDVRTTQMQRAKQLSNKREKKLATIWTQAALAMVKGELEKRRQAE